MKATQLLYNLGQSIWLDNITRDLLDTGTLRRYIDELSVTGLTSNPTIFERAIRNSPSYDVPIREKLAAGTSGEGNWPVRTFSASQRVLIPSSCATSRGCPSACTPRARSATHSPTQPGSASVTCPSPVSASPRRRTRSPRRRTRRRSDRSRDRGVGGKSHHDPTTAAHRARGHDRTVF